MTGAAMLVGLNCQPADYTTHLSGAFRGAALCRVFGPAGSGIPAVTGPRVAGLPPGCTPWISFKDWPSDVSATTAVNTWLGHLDRPVWLTYHHEPEGDLAPPLYRRRWWQLGSLVEAHPHAGLVTLVPIQTLQWTEAGGAGKGNGDPFVYWAGLGRHTAPYAGMDCYAPSWIAAYPDPEAFLATAWRLADGTGRQLVVPELGAVRSASDAAGLRRADWIRQVTGRLRAGGAAAVSWWCAPGANGRDFHLSDQPGARAWRDVITGGA